MANYEFYHPTDTAKVIRRLLKATYPGQKFRVYCQTDTVHIVWLDGPSFDEVDNLTKAFEGKGFDGMVDLQYSGNSWLMPDNTAVLADSSGTVGSAGSVPGYDNPAPHPDAKLVYFGCWIQPFRRYSQVFLATHGHTAADELHIEHLPQIVSDGYWKGGDGFVFTNESPRYFSQPETTGTILTRAMGKISAYNPPSNGSAPPAADLDPSQFEVVQDRDWLWITFGGKPSEAVRNILKYTLGARWSRKRTAWYIKGGYEVSQVEAALSGS